ncbi:uncharacterized protein LOC133905980 [Phragmites australis]|uniref:uncharacterized protein LOC133905980 n=1 Tax=Phragmites australis TaxID=29695 RepID=UPI002D788BF5|nr:uncharacterized protein LOC133905980 [Phragmites australis]
MAPYDSSDWLRRSDTYQRQNVPLPYRVQERIMTSTETTKTPIQLPGDCTPTYEDIVENGSIIDVTNTPRCPIPGDDDVIFEEDSEEEEGYMFADGDTDEDVKFDETDDASATISSIPDLYDHMYSNIPSTTHMLK